MRADRYIEDLAALGRRIAERREAVGLSQRKLARGICTAAYVSRLEKGERQPSQQMLELLARRMGSSVGYLATGEATPAERGLLAGGVALSELTEEERYVFDVWLDDHEFLAAEEWARELGRMREGARLRELQLTLTQA